MKENFHVGRIFWNITDLNRAAMNWCNQQNSTYHKAAAGVPQELRYSRCAEQIRTLEINPDLLCTSAVMHRFLGISRSGYYAFAKRLGQPESDAELVKKIE